MAEAFLATYLNDHLAGSVVAIELLEQLEKAHAGEPVGRFAADLKADILPDRADLEALMKRLGVTTSAPRRVMAWLTEKAGEIKLKMDDPAGGALRVLESIEAVSIGIDGKRALWRSLAAASEGNPRLRGVDYSRLEARAEQQRRRCEEVRLDAAREALKAG